ncbi:MAG: class I SAM-dependent methyltransferase [Thermodesulfobacteriota bacterium]|nr:class I SAM-dependent methyltransferase [Thermodesulfobacteriota bacterium]
MDNQMRHIPPLGSNGEYHCPVCDSKDILPFLQIPQVPVHINLLFDTKEEALSVPKADMELGFCKGCGHVYNFTFDAQLMDYTEDYENPLHFSARFRKYADKLAQSLVERYQLYNKSIIEIGSGDGQFLGQLCELGNNKGIGFDPSHKPDADSALSKKNITFINDYYSDEYAECKADLICCRHVLEHIHYPRDFMRALRHAIVDRPDTVLFFEVPNAMFTLKDLGIWDVIYEHCSYFTPQSLSRLFGTSGFHVKEMYEVYEGQFICLEALPKTKGSPDDDSFPVVDAPLQSYVNEFREGFNRKIKQWWHSLGEMLRKEQRIVVWGAGSKGATFLNVNNRDNDIHYVVDINPRKHGMFVSGAGQEIVPPEFLRDYDPDVVLIMNPIYAEEIKQVIKQLHLSCEIRHV